MSTLTKTGKTKDPAPAIGPDTGAPPRLSGEHDVQRVRQEPPVRTSDAARTEGVLAARASRTEMSAAPALPVISAAKIQRSTANYEMRNAFQQRMEAFDNRAIDKAEMAALMNQYRHNPWADGADNTITHKKLLKGVFKDNQAHRIKNAINTVLRRDAVEMPVRSLARFARAAGLTDREWNASKLMTTIVAHAIPLGGVAINLAAYPLPPLLTMNAPVWNGVAARLTVAALQALVTSAIQPFVVQAQEGVRQKHAPSIVRDAKAVNVKMTPYEIAMEMARETPEVQQGAQRTAARVSELCSAHGVAAPAEASMEAVMDRLRELHTKLDAEGKTELEGLLKTQADLWRDAGARILQALGTDSVVDRERTAREDQRLVRTPRSGAGLPSLFVKPLPHEHSFMDHVKTTSRWTTEQATALTAVFAVAMIFGQMPLASLDERRHTYRRDVAMAVLYNDFCNDKGHADLRLGKPVTADGIDEDKCRKNTFVSPERATMGRVSKVLDARLKRAQAKLAKMDDAAGPKRHEQQARVNELTQDIAVFKQEKPNVMALRQGGEAERLLDSAIKPWAIMFKLIDGFEKLISGDFGVQFGERLGQSLMVGVGGNLAAIALTSIVLAALGGSKEVGLDKQLGIQLLGLALGFTAASLLYTASVMKARTRDGGDMGLGSQTFYSAMAPISLAVGHFKKNVSVKLGPLQKTSAAEEFHAAMQTNALQLRAATQMLMEIEEAREAEEIARGDTVEVPLHAKGTEVPDGGESSTVRNRSRVTELPDDDADAITELPKKQGESSKTGS